MKKMISITFLLASSIATVCLPSCKEDPIGPPTPVPTSVTDIDGNVYPVKQIGTQIWMTENLRTARYKDGTTIATGLTALNWAVSTLGAYAIYDDEPNNNATHGKLYNWQAVNSQKLAPEGYHVATTDEWNQLLNHLGGFAVAGGKMKSTATIWNAPNTGADNSSGFNALPSGFRGTTGSYTALGNLAYFWSATERNATQANYTNLQQDMASALSNGATKTFGYSVRCVKN